MSRKLKADFSAKGTPENDNCYIRAVSTAMNIEYDEALMICLDAGWENGMPLDLALKMAVEREWTIVGCSWWHDGDSLFQEIDSEAHVKFPMCTVGALCEKLRETKKTYIVLTNDHALCVKNGYVYDNGETGRMKRVTMFFEVPVKESQEMGWGVDIGDELY